MEKVKQDRPMNGLVAAIDLNRRALSPSQQKYLQRLISILGRAEAAQEAAQEALALAQSNAGDFVGYCAEELGITLGADGWRFDQQTTSFIREMADAEYST